MFSPTLRRFLEQAPVAVAMRAALERLFRPQWLDTLFTHNAQKQINDQLLFSSVVELMGQVVLGQSKSVHAAYRGSGIAQTVNAVYDKLKGLELPVSTALVQQSAQEALAVLEHIPLPPPLLEGHEIRILDGNHLAGTEHRIKETRQTRSAALPGQSLVVLDPRRRLMLDVVPCENAHTQERLLITQILDRVRPGEVWMGDRNFCTTVMVTGIVEKEAFYILRQHVSTLRCEQAGEWEDHGRISTGHVYEQAIRVWDPSRQQWMNVRRIRLDLDKPTESGDEQIYVLTNLPKETVASGKVAELYKERWQVERAFGELTASLNCEIRTLAYPRAALFGFCLALLAYNAVSLVRNTMNVAHGLEEDEVVVEKKGKAKKVGISYYHMAQEMARVGGGMEIAMPVEQWREFGRMSAKAFARTLLELCGRMELWRYEKSPRGPKKKRTTRKAHGRKVKHIATAKVLAARKADSSTA